MWKSFFVLAVLFSARVTASSEAREWTDSTGVFTVEASFVEVDGKTVLLRKPNGVVVEVPLERFSEADRRYLSSLPGVDVPPANEAIDRIERALARKWAFDFVDTPLDDVVKFLAEHGEMDVRLDRRAMDDRGIGAESPVTMQNKARPLAEVLPVMLLPLRLTWIVRDDVLLITSVTEVESSPETRVYFPRGEQDLSALRQEMKARFGPRFACQMVAPGVLLVRQTYWGHCAIEEEYGDKLDFIRPTRTAIVPGVVPERLNLALNQCTPVYFLDTPLHQVGDFLAASGKIGITFDSQALSEIGISEDVPITLNLNYARLRCVFDLLLRDLDLAWIPNETGIIITTPEEARRKVEIDYGVRGLSRDPFCADLIEAIKSTVAPQTWHYHDTSIALNRERGQTLTIRTMMDVHWEISQVLQDLRQANRRCRGASNVSSG